MKLRRSERMVVISNYLINNPYQLTSLNTFAERYEAAIFTGLIPALIFLILICLPLFIAKRLTMVEYDYEFTDGELEISAIYERVRRKVKGNINLREIEIIAPLGNSELNRYSNVKVKKCYNNIQEGKMVYVIVVRWETKMVAYEVLIDQKMLDLFFFSNPQKVIR